MDPSLVLYTIGGGLYILLGSLHGLYTLLDIREPRRFFPRDRAVYEAMTGTTVRLTRGRATMWNAWLGFNLSHSLGVVVIGLVAIGMGTAEVGVLASQGASLGLLVVSGALLAIAIPFWFRIPIAGTAMASACFLVAFLLRFVVGS